MPKHIHKYRRFNIAKKPKEHWVMRCILDGCPHYTHMNTKLSAPLLLKKIGLCNKCNEPFEMTRRALVMERPTCKDCRGVNKREDVEKAEDFFQRLEREIDHDA